MPTYEYLCTACRERTEVLHGRDGTGPSVCPSCGAEGTMRKAFAAPAILFKGSGWAKKERRSAPASSSSKTASSDDAGSSGGSGGSSEGGTTSGDAGADGASTKPAAKTTKDPAPASGTAASD